MASGPTERLQQELRRITEADIHKADREAIRTVVNDLGDYNRRGINPEIQTKSAYCSNLRRVAEYVHQDGTLLIDHDPDAINALISEMKDANDWTSKTTVKQYQSALKALASYLGYERGDIDIDKSPQTTGQVDPRTVLSPEQFHAIRDNAATMRDRCIIDLLGFTGQRLRVIQSLTIGDVNPEEGIWYVPDAHGLKGVDKVARKRPLLGARRTVEEWLGMHPTGRDDDRLITTLGSNHGYGNDSGEEISGTTIRDRIQIAAERAPDDVIDPDETPVNPHAFRHFFVTIAKKRYDMNKDVIKRLIGHVDSSSVMETTYRHLDDEYHIGEARKQFWGEDHKYVDDGDDAGFAPPVCPTCGTPLRPETETCPTPTCGEVFVPESGEDSIGGLHEDATEAAITSTNPDEIAALKAIREAADDPAALAEKLRDIE